MYGVKDDQLTVLGAGASSRAQRLQETRLLDPVPAPCAWLCGRAMLPTCVLSLCHDESQFSDTARPTTVRANSVTPPVPLQVVYSRPGNKPGLFQHVSRRWGSPQSQSSESSFAVLVWLILIFRARTGTCQRRFSAANPRPPNCLTNEDAGCRACEHAAGHVVDF